MLCEASRIISIVAIPVYILLRANKSSSLPTSLAAFVVICFLDDSHCDWSVKESQDSFNLHFLDLLAICIFSLKNLSSLAHF